jgi:hypothetical protein
MDDGRWCQECQQQPRKPHPNAKYCAGCAAALVHRPRSRVTPAQAAQLRPLLNRLPKAQIAQQGGISGAALTRWLREEGLHTRCRQYRPEVVQAVLRVYEREGKVQTAQRFPDVAIRSIVERYKDYQPRQIRWTDLQQIEAARMAGLVSATAQARYFGRPNAYEGSIRALWVKRFQCPPHAINGVAAGLAWGLAQPGCPAVLVKHQRTTGAWPRVLWLDLVQHLRPDVLPWVRQAVEVLARFQQWLHGTDDPAAIRRMIQERERDGAQYDPGQDEWPPAPSDRAAGDLQRQECGADVGEFDGASHAGGMHGADRQRGV